MYPKIIIKTSDDHTAAGSNGNLYMEVCDTSNSNTCCKQTFNGRFEVGSENTFAFSAEFQKCLESSKKLYYFLGITGTDGWKSKGLEIYFDGLTKEVCTLDGGKWLDGDSDNPEGKFQPRLPLNCQK